MTLTSAPYLETLYQAFLRDPQSVSLAWRQFFEVKYFEGGTQAHKRLEHAPEEARSTTQDQDLQERATAYLSAWRQWGHRVADLNPLFQRTLDEATLPQELCASTHSISAREMQRVVSWRGSQAPLNVHLEELQKAYAGPLTLECGSGAGLEEAAWLHEAFEAPPSEPSAEHKCALWQTLLQASVFEETLKTTFPGAKRFGLEGAESLLILLQALRDFGRHAGNTLKEQPAETAHIVLGMAHRGRLNVMHHLCGFGLEHLGALFREEEAVWQTPSGHDDVKYHLGAEVVYPAEGEASECRMSLLANPSHLGFTTPVVLGYVRGLLDDQQNASGIVVHGDAAFAGQGVVAESLLLSHMDPYAVGGIVHVVLDNQVGFTASGAQTAPQTRTCAVASGYAPIIHVNADQPEAVWRAAQIVHQFRKRFARDIVVRLLGYRRMGHNEMDEPRFTNPQLYAVIDQHTPVLEQYQTALCNEGVLSSEEALAGRAQLKKRYKAALQEGLPVPEVAGKTHIAEQAQMLWQTPGTGLTQAHAQALAAPLVRAIDDANCPLHPKVKGVLERRIDMLSGACDFDWAGAEYAALGSLLLEGCPVRLLGQDAVRGTFSQRHAGVYGQAQGSHLQSTAALSESDPIVPLAQLGAGASAFQCWNTPLSEAAALGAEVGYSWSAPTTLVLWEAQFGDFANGAQVIIDQYMAAAQQKWGMSSKLVLLLPHGYEGQGPEHSSARPERFLQLAAQNNMRVLMPSTPASYFHALRAQALSQTHVPCVIFTPKSLLRHPQAISRKELLETSGFVPLLCSQLQETPERLILCSGKVFYDVAAHQEKEGARGAVVALESLYPLPEDALLAGLMKQVGPEAPVVWVQEEPENMGAWTFVRDKLEGMLGKKLHYCGRGAAASPASGFAKCHAREQEAIVKRAFKII